MIHSIKGTQKWECLFVESEKIGPPPRSSSSISYWSNKVFMIGGKTKIRYLANSLWVFDLGFVLIQNLFI
jgi:hypothetical protein